MTDKTDKNKTNTQVKHLPKDAQVIMAIMKELGVSDYEPRVINQLLEFIYRYVTSALEDARVYANHAKKKIIDVDDVRLALQMQLDKSFTGPPPREVLWEIARVKNVNPLPIIKPHCGLRLPPDRYCLSSCNYRLKPAAVKKVAPKPLVGVTPKPMPMKNTTPQNVVMKRAPVNTKPTPAPKPTLKFSAGPKVIFAFTLQSCLIPMVSKVQPI